MQCNPVTMLSGFTDLRQLTSSHNPKPNCSTRRLLSSSSPPPCAARRRPSPPPTSPEIVPALFFEENPFVLISSVLLVQPDEGVSDLVVDRIGDNLPQSTEKSRIIVITVGDRHKCQQDRKNENRGKTTGPPPRLAALAAVRFRVHVARRLAHRLRMVAEALAVPRARRCAVGSVLVDASSMAGRTIAHMLAHVSDGGRASAPRDCDAGVAPPRATMGEAVRRETPLLAGDGAHSLRVLHAARCARLRAASRAAAAFSWWRRRRRRPPLRRCSGESPVMS
ncbi:hypothetical protein F511_45194 [Dorcoceras hygrometricum]|uniref:Uncharacterized protein n=1 Tax=Dorcoceras hygrometricum TaxID=472368 RepID=A0A2Z6ZWM6_9LAMI|nr:hypothetical protein F511_45194 [Dorcoceras hygrometricum]